MELSPQMGFWDAQLRDWWVCSLGCNLKWAWFPAGVVAIGWN